MASEGRQKPGEATGAAKPGAGPNAGRSRAGEEAGPDPPASFALGLTRCGWHASKAEAGGGTTRRHQAQRRQTPTSYQTNPPKSSLVSHRARPGPGRRPGAPSGRQLPRRGARPHCPGNPESGRGPGGPPRPRTESREAAARAGDNEAQIYPTRGPAPGPANGRTPVGRWRPRPAGVGQSKGGGGIEDRPPLLFGLGLAQAVPRVKQEAPARRPSRRAGARWSRRCHFLLW